MKGRMKGKGKHSAAKQITREHNLSHQSEESTGSTKHVGSAYGMPKGPKQPMAGAVKRAALPHKTRRATGANYAGSAGS